MTQQNDTATDEAISRSSAMMTGIVLVSRLTGFVRTWAQAFALGATMLASCYTVANNLPNLLFEITIAGMLYTAFLPVYMSVKKKSGIKGASDYTSNMASIIILLMGVLTVIAFIFASPLVFTQSAGANSETFSFETAEVFLRFFCIEVLFYPLSALLTSVLNAERKFFWGQAAPIFNNLIVIASFLLGALFLQENYMLAFTIIAIGNPLGVAVQLFVQMPAMRKAGIRFKFRIDWKDPSLRDTVRIGVPSLLVTICAAVLASVQSSCSLVEHHSGAAILYYVRVWFVLPASLLSVPVSTATFTELSDLYAQKKLPDFRIRAIKGLQQILFFMIPFTFYLIAFSQFLMALLGSSSFDEYALSTSISTLAVMSTALIFYALAPYLQNVFAAMHRLGFYSASYAIATIVACLGCAISVNYIGILGAALSYTLFYCLIVVAALIRLRAKLGSLGMKEVLKQAFIMTALGILGALGGWGASFVILYICDVQTLTFGYSLVCLVIGGIASLVITYGLAYIFKVPAARTMFGALLGRFGR